MRAIIFFAAVILSACTTVSRDPQFADDLAAQGLTPSSSSQFSVIYVRDGVDIGNLISVEALDSSNTIIDDDAMSNAWVSRQRGRWELTEADHGRMAESFSSAIDDAFSDSPLILTNTAAPNTLVITPRLAKIRPNAPRDTTDQRAAGEHYYTEGSGDMWIVFEGRIDGELVLWLEKRTQAGHLWEENNRVTTWRNMRNTLGRWSRALETELSELSTQ